MFQVWPLKVTYWAWSTNIDIVSELSDFIRCTIRNIQSCENSIQLSKPIYISKKQIQTKKKKKTSNQLSLNSMLSLLNFLYLYDHWFFNKDKKGNFTCLIPTTFPLPVVVRESAPRITPSAYSIPMMVVYTNQEYWKYKFVQRLQNKRRWKDFQFQNNFSIVHLIDQRCWKMIINVIFFVELDAKGIFDCSLIDQKSFKKDSQCTLFYWIWCNGILDWLMSLRKDYQCDFFYWIWYSAIFDWSKSLGKDYQCTILWWLWCNGIIDWSKSLKKDCWCNFFCWI